METSGSSSTSSMFEKLKLKLTPEETFTRCNLYKASEILSSMFFNDKVYKHKLCNFFDINEPSEEGNETKTGPSIEKRVTLLSHSRFYLILQIDLFLSLRSGYFQMREPWTCNEMKETKGRERELRSMLNTLKRLANFSTEPDKHP